MKLIKCLELGEECGLTTVAEAMRNVIIHDTQLFTWHTIVDEIGELRDEYDRVILDGGFTGSSTITEVKKWLRDKGMF